MMLQSRRKSWLILLSLLTISMSACESASCQKIKPNVSKTMDMCVDRAYDNVPECVQAALRQWSVQTQ